MSSDTVMSWWPWGEKVNRLMGNAWPVKLPTYNHKKKNVFVLTLENPETCYGYIFPSRKKGSCCSSRVHTCDPLVADQSLTCPSMAAEAMCVPDGLYATSRTALRWPRRIWKVSFSFVKLKFHRFFLRLIFMYPTLRRQSYHFTCQAHNRGTEGSHSPGQP